MGLKLVVSHDAPSDGINNNNDQDTPIETIFIKHKVSLFRYIFRMVRCEQDALELLQEAYTRLIEQSVNSTGKLTRGYLFTVALNLVRDRARRNASHMDKAHDSLNDIDILDNANTPDEQLAWRQGLNTLKDAIKELPERQRKIFLMRRFKHLSCQQIADILGISKRTVERELVVAIDYCRAQLKDFTL